VSDTAARPAPSADRVRPSFGHVPALDGLRGLAVAGVLLFHAGHLRGGYLGVDLFFVLSGFLISSLLLAEWDASGRIDLRRFWSRRVRRLLPAALLLLTAAAVLAGATLSGPELHRFRGDALSALFDVFNWHAIRSGSDYWAQSSAPSPLQHMWSLSIEEQLYLAWPVAVVGCLALGRRRRAGRRVLVLAALAGVAASIAAMAWWSTHGHDLRAYYGTDARASSVLLGGLMAVVVDGQHRRPRVDVGRAVRSAVPVAVVGLAWAWVWAAGTSSWLYCGGLPLLSLAAAVVVGAVALAGPGRGMRLLEVPALRWLGRISYGVYLWHWPIYTVVDEDVVGDRWPRTAVRIVLSLAVASLSYELVEQPIRRGDLPTRWWRLVAPLGAVAVVTSTLVATAGSAAPPQSGRVIHRDRGLSGALSVLLMGDSEAYTLGLGHIAVYNDVDLSVLPFFGCGVAPGVSVVGTFTIEQDVNGVRCVDVVDRMQAEIDRIHPDVVLLHVGAFEVFDRYLDGRYVRYGSAEWDRVVEQGLVRVLRRFGAGGQRVVASAASCYEPRDIGQEELLPHEEVELIGAARAQDRRVRHWNDLLRAAAAATGVTVLPYDDLYCGVPTAQQPDRPDGVHLSAEGAQVVWRWLLPQLEAAAGR
jgi:peptidoglycan/LPS O-acetylase OafA/YrhL